MNEARRLPEQEGKRRGRGCRALAFAAALGIACAGFAAQKKAADPERLGRELARRVLKVQDSSGFQVRARVIIGEEGENAPRPSILQVRIAGRSEEGLQRILYQVFWPAPLKGYAAVIEHSRAPMFKGFLFEPPGRVTPFGPALLETSFAGSGLTIEDIAENFWRWPMQRVSGQGRAGKRACTLLESRPSPDVATTYSLVRSCVEPRRAVPLWIEKFGKDGRRIRRISFETPDRKERGGDLRASMVVEGTASSPRTRVEILKIEKGIKIPPDEFSPERLEKLAGKPGS